jgi:hypothetical protein
VAFPLGYSAYEVHARNAKLLAKLARESKGNVAVERQERRKLTQAVTPADDLRLRGLPCVGNRLGGAIRWTRPEAEALRREGQRL